MGKSTFAERLNAIIQEQNIRQIDLCKKTGIGKSAMSQYLRGSFAPKQQKLYDLAEALNVSEAWLMGYDVPRERKIVTSSESDDADSFYFTIHDNSCLLYTSCAAIPNSLVESELFGYEKGTFTGAEKEGRPGKFEMADGGTIFLDEIGDMPYAVQAALLRVLQTKEVVRVGGKYPKPVNIRVIAATNQDLTEAVAQKTFREDLFYRLNVLTIAVPPLRDRGADDISLLISHFVDMYNKKRHTDITVAPQVYQVLRNYSWPGNVRQLENTVERAISLCSDDMITCEDLPPQFCDMIAAQSNGLSLIHISH